MNVVSIEKAVDSVRPWWTVNGVGVCHACPFVAGAMMILILEKRRLQLAGFRKTC